MPLSNLYELLYFPLFSNGDNMSSTLKALNERSLFTVQQC